MSVGGRIASLFIGLAMGGFLLLVSPDHTGVIAAAVVVGTLVLLPLAFDALERWSPPDGED